MTTDAGPDDRITGRRIALAVLAAAQFMSILDATIVTVALPSIGTDLDLSASSLSWVVNAYVLTFGGFLLLAGRTADLVGRRAVLMAGWGLFGAASLACGLAPTGGALIAGRAVQGLGAALMVPAALSLLTTIFSGRALATAFGVWGAVSGGAGAIGVLLGGTLTDAVGWEWVFLINVPIALAGALAAPAVLPQGRLEHAPTHDVAGGLTVTAGLSLLVYAIVETEDNGWASVATLGLVGGALVLLAAFLVIESRAKDPLVRLGFFRNGPVATANLAAVLFGASVLVPLFFFVTLYLQQVLGYTPQEAGFAFLPIGVGSFVGAGIASNVMNRVGPRPVLVGALALQVAGLLGFAQISAGGGYVADVLWPATLIGIGLGPVVVALTAAGTEDVGWEEAGLASGLINTTQQIGGAIGLAALVALATSRTEDLVAAAGGAPAAVPGALVDGFQLALYLGAGLAAIALLIALIGPRAPRAPATPPGTAPGPAAAGAA